MTWFRADDDLPEHVKADALEAAAGDPATLAAAWMVWLHMGCDCAKRRTDGLFQRARAHRAVRLPPAMTDAGLAALVTAGLMRLDAPDAFRFHDWADYQPTRADLDEQRKAATERQRKRRGLSQRDTAVTHDASTPVSQAVSRPESHEQSAATSPVPVTAPRPVPSRPLPTEGEERPERAGAGVPPSRPAPAPKAVESETPPADPLARAVFDAITADPMLGPVTSRPADLAARLTAPDAFPGVNVLGQVLRALAWNAGQRKPKRDGRAFLLGWLGRSDPEAPSPLASGKYPAAQRPDEDDAADPWAVGLARLEKETARA